MKILISLISADEALAVADGGADIVDIKNVDEGSLGASFPWIIRDVKAALRDRKACLSASLGDLPYKPGTASLAALGATACGVQYVKAGLHGVRGYDDAVALLEAVTRACKELAPATIVAAASYADYRRFGGIDPRTLVRACGDAGADLAMLDTAKKDGKSLFDALATGELDEFIGRAREGGLQIALAGSLGFEHADRLQALDVDVVGVRGCVCADHDRTNRIDAQLVRRFVAALRIPRIV
jgi:(5-formylfuran-3-yl)methyl phosphate synthase